MKFTLNPIAQFNQVAGISMNTFTHYDPQKDMAGYYDALYRNNSEFNGTTFKLDSVYGLPIADRFLEFELDESTFLTIEMPILKISRPRVMVKTSIAGYNHQIKELICEGDFEISLTCYVAALRPMNTNWEQLKMINRLCSLTKNIKVYSALLNNVFDIKKVVVDGLADISQHDQYNNIYIVNLDLIGDEDYTPFKKDK